MKTNSKSILESDLLERYLLGETNVQEDLHVEYLLETNREVREAFANLEESLEILAGAVKAKAPADVKEALLSEIREENTFKNQGKAMPWYFIAASAASLVFAIATVVLWKQNKALTESQDQVVSQINQLKGEIIEANSSLEDVKSKFAVLNNPDTRKYYITGNERAKNLKTVAYINPKERLTAIDIVSMPDLPEEKEMKMWAEVNGTMICLGTLEQADKKLMALPFNEDITNFKITIEAKGNNDFATIDSEVADIKID